MRTGCQACRWRGQEVPGYEPVPGGTRAGGTNLNGWRQPPHPTPLHPARRHGAPLAAPPRVPVGGPAGAARRRLLQVPLALRRRLHLALAAVRRRPGGGVDHLAGDGGLRRHPPGLGLHDQRQLHRRGPQARHVSRDAGHERQPARPRVGGQPRHRRHAQHRPVQEHPQPVAVGALDGPRPVQARQPQLRAIPPPPPTTPTPIPHLTQGAGGRAASILRSTVRSRSVSRTRCWRPAPTQSSTTTQP